jgi:hypothetical protein
MSDPQQIADTASILEKALWVYGPMALILVYMLYKDFVDRKEIKKELNENKQLINNVLTQLVGEYNSAAEENKEQLKLNNRVFLELQVLIKQFIVNGRPTPEASLDAHDTISKAVQAKNKMSGMQRVKMTSDGLSTVAAEAETDVYPVIK